MSLFFEISGVKSYLLAGGGRTAEGLREILAPEESQEQE